MRYSKETWKNHDYAKAIANAINQNANPRFLRSHGNTLKFNGFWRNGDKQNVCAWLDKGTWHDAKTGEGGGCKEFANIAFGVTLKEFMERFSTNQTRSIKQIEKFKKETKVLSKDLVEQIFNNICRVTKRTKSIKWLSESRNINEPERCLGSGFADLDKECVMFFPKNLKNFVDKLIETADQMVVPLRGVGSISVRNFYFRSISHCPKENKSRMLPNAGGCSDSDGTPLAFGFPHLIKDFSNVILCEGMIDYFAAEYLLDSEQSYLPLGVTSATAFKAWSEWLIKEKYDGNIIVIYHLDTDKHGNLSDTGVGQNYAVECVRNLISANIKAKFFPWTDYLKSLNNFSTVRDLADSLNLGLNFSYLHEIFLNQLRG